MHNLYYTSRAMKSPIKIFGTTKNGRGSEIRTHETCWDQNPVPWTSLAIPQQKEKSRTGKSEIGPCTSDQFRESNPNRFY